VVAFSEDEYLLALGRLCYAVSYLEWSVLGDLPRISGLPQELQLRNLAGHSTGTIGRRFSDPAILGKVDAPDVRSWLETAGEHLTAVAKRRNSVLHARPATIDGKQRLHRWSPDHDEVFTITEELLEEILADITDRLRDLTSRRIARA
jgi:hypothetical protein